MLLFYHTSGVYLHLQPACCSNATSSAHFFKGDELLEVMSGGVATKSSFLELPSESTTPSKAYTNQLQRMSSPAKK